MNMQQELFNQDLTVPFVHHRENNPSSEKHYEENKVHFSNQCKALFDYLMKGNEVNDEIARNVLKIRHVPRRKLDLREAGVIISGEKWENRLLVFWMDENDKIFNMKFQ
jgi:hypothetical protein